VLWLTEETGQDVITSDGTVLGPVRDLSAHLGGETGAPVVSRLVIGCRGARLRLVTWADIESFEHTRVMLRATATWVETTRSDISDALDPDELLLVRDVLDTQIVDIAGQRVARVADVILTRHHDSRLELVAVETGFGRIVRRIGLHRVAHRLPEHAVAWADLHLTSARGHDVQLATPRSAVHRIDAAGLAALVTQLDIESASDVLDAVGPSRAADALVLAQDHTSERVLRALETEKASEIVAAMPERHARQWRHRLARRAPINRRRFFRTRRYRRAQRAAEEPR
jgi:sporulation protein YlmC with PRC-barrel domain